MKRDEILIIKKLKGLSKLLNLRVESIIAFQNFKLTSNWLHLDYFKFPKRSELVRVAPAWFKMLLWKSVILLKRVFVSARKLWQWRRKWHVFSMSQPQIQSGFNVSWKLYLHLYSGRFMKSRVKNRVWTYFCQLQR